jgi:thiol-disulfide isomerase/thioredoxin
MEPILLYSTYCPYSKDLLTNLRKLSDVYNAFNVINMDTDKSTGKRPTIFYQLQKKYNLQSIPVLILRNGTQVIQGKDTLDWLMAVFNDKNQQEQEQEQEQEINPSRQNKDFQQVLQGFNENGMSDLATLTGHENLLNGQSSNLTSLYNTDSLWDGKDTVSESLDMNNTISYQELLAKKEAERKEFEEKFGHKTPIA